MSRTKVVSCVVSLACLLFAGRPAVSLACGFHDPVMIARGMLNWSYPNALYVTGAVWQGQRAGELDMPDRARLQARGETRRKLDEQAFQRATVALHALGGGVESAGAPTDPPSMAIVLIEPMLWTRFLHAGDHVGVVGHTNGPQQGDLVLVTDVPVLHAIEQGRLSVAEAKEQGFLRLYGTPEQERVFLEAYGTIGDDPLPEVPARTMWRRNRLGNELQGRNVDGSS